MNLIKGTGRLIETWKKIDLKEAQLYLLGNIDCDINKILNQINPQNIKLVNATNSPDIFYRQADVMIQPSLSDAGPFTIFEAMACGLPVICSNTCGASYLIKNFYNGIVFDINDFDKLNEAIIWFYKNPNKIKQMGIAARKTVENCRIDNFNEKILYEIDRGINEISYKR